MPKTFTVHLYSWQTILFLALFNTISNFHLWKIVTDIPQAGPFEQGLFLFSFTLTLFSVLVILFNIILVKHFDKFIIPFILIANAAVLYFMDEYHIIIDQSMLNNMLQTDVHEATDYFNLSFFAALICLGVMPSVLFLCGVKTEYKKFAIERKQRLLSVMASVLCILTIFFSFNKTYTSFLRTHREIKHEIVPVNYLDASRALFAVAPEKRPLIKISENAELSSVWRNVKVKTVVIMVVGETARAKNFSLLGYERETNPGLRQVHDLFTFSNVSSCGTSTAISLPCLFSPQTRKEFKTDLHQENVLDIIRQAGFKVVWRDNNSGCKGVCDRVEFQKQIDFMPSPYCQDDICFDQALLHDLDKVFSGPEDK
ncbi:MAG: DUF1705 domain-containing protein, partial [Bacteriovoracaceae bacterium]|nr:DUF1705 domain-containing protein [Bacteriovoracaceae bacterium]